MSRKIRDFSKEVLATYIERGMFVDSRFNSIEDTLDAIDRTLKIIKLEEEVKSLDPQLKDLPTGSRDWFKAFGRQEALFAKQVTLTSLPHVFEMLPSYQEKLKRQSEGLDLDEQ